MLLITEVFNGYPIKAMASLLHRLKKKALLYGFMLVHDFTICRTVHGFCTVTDEMDWINGTDWWGLRSFHIVPDENDLEARHCLNPIDL